MTASLPHVQLTSGLRESLEDEGYDADHFAEYFAEWKSLGHAGEYGDYFFGKDGLYDQPRRSNKRVLHHVHLPPYSDPVALAEWDREYARQGRKTSDSVLVYVFDPVNGFLLLHMVREPDGHSFSDMRTQESVDFMNELADSAEKFIYQNIIDF